MNVDEIPGFGGAPYPAPPLTPASAAGDLHQSHLNHNVVSDALSNASEGQTHDHLPSSTDSASAAFTYLSVDTVSAATDRQSLQRRGTKRPVAADFDLDMGPRPQYNGSGVYSNGASSAKHKPIGFASVSGMRRCVIDLSDSEGEGDEDGLMKDVANLKARWGRRSGYPSPAPVVNTPNGWITPPVAAITPVVTAAGIIGASMSPAALAEKETEIRKMREMIAQRERDRQKKLAASRSMVSIDTPIKQEELDVGLSLAASAQANEASQLPNGRASGTPPDSTVAYDHAATGLALLADVVSTMPSSPLPGPTTSSIDHHTSRDVVYDDINMTTEVQGKFHSASLVASLVAPPC